MKATVLVVANRTAASPELVAALAQRAEGDAARFDLVVPPRVPGAEGREAARASLEGALKVYAEAGLEAEGRVGTDVDPVVAVIEAYEPARHDEVLISTLPESASHWLRVDGPARIAKQTGALVRHVIANEPRAAHRTTHVEPKPSQGVLSPLVALRFGGPRER
jgi:hypothetical protein